MRSSVDSLSRASLEPHLLTTNTIMSRNPVKTISSNLHQFYVTDLVFVLTADNLLLFSPALAMQTVNWRKSLIYFPETGMPVWEQIRLPAALQCKQNSDILVLVDMRRGYWGNRWHCCSSYFLIHFGIIQKSLNTVLMLWCHFTKSLFIDFRMCTIFFKSCKRQADLGFRPTPRRGVRQPDVINYTQVNLWILKQWQNMKAKRRSQLGFFKGFWVWWFKNTAIAGF